MKFLSQTRTGMIPEKLDINKLKEHYRDKETNEYIRGVACPKCYKNTTDEQKARYMSRQKQVDLAKKRNQKHIGPREEIRKSKI